MTQGKYAEAEAEYEKIIQEFPNEIKPHVDMINIAIRWMEDGQLAEELYQRGMTLLQDPTDRDTFTQMYTAIRTRLKSQDEKNGRTIPFENVKEIRERLARDRHKLWR